MRELNITKIELHQNENIEQLGTKKKFWIKNNSDNLLKLFKIGRLNTGENWTEVVVSEICTLLNIPHAEYMFAKWENEEGTITPSFVPKDHRLIHGNELLVETGHYDKENYKNYKTREYKLKLILKIMKDKKLKVPINYKSDVVKTPIDAFIGYIMLDCLISNQDRHHENWGWISSPDKKLYLSPSYDHASGLGCRVSDEDKQKRLNSADKGFKVESFVKKAKTPFYHQDKRLTTIEAFKLCGDYNKQIAINWLKKLEGLDIKEIERYFDSIPKHLIKNISIEFALKILEENKKRLIALKGEFKE